jgi:hypothetical protein
MGLSAPRRMAHSPHRWRGNQRCGPGLKPRTLTRDIVPPLISVRMPMHLTQATWLDFDEGGSDGLADWKQLGVSNPHGAAFRADRSLRHHAVTEAVGHLRHARDLVGR